jgi:predicted transcriptional regulator of viral defense system
MKTRKDKLIQLFKKNKGILRFSQVLKVGFLRKHLKTLLDAGTIKRISRGFYKLTDSPEPSNPDLVAVALKAPKGVICLISALSYHNATDEVPQSVYVAIPRGLRANKINYPPVQYFHYNPKVWEHGIETSIIDGHPVRIYGLAKTIADCFKYRNKIGLDVAREAMKIAVNEKKVNPTEIMRFAKICRVDKIMKPYVEALL